MIKHRDLPERCVLCFFREAIDKAKEKLDFKPLRPLGTEMGEIPLYSALYEGHALGIIPAAVGAPLAAGLFEEVDANSLPVVVLGCSIAPLTAAILWFP